MNVLMGGFSESAPPLQSPMVKDERGVRFYGCETGSVTTQSHRDVHEKIECSRSSKVSEGSDDDSPEPQI